jgi:hypothetical protein
MFSSHLNNGSFCEQVKNTFFASCCGMVAHAEKVHILIFWISKSETEQVGIAVMLIFVSGRKQSDLDPVTGCSEFGRGFLISQANDRVVPSNK